MIRPMKQEDFFQVLEMMIVFYASDALIIHPDEECLRTTLTDCIAGGPYLEGYVFERDGQMVGYGMLAKSYSTEAGGLCVWIEDIYVRPEHRGKGLGSGFLSFVDEKYGDTAARIRLEAEPDNENAIAVYRKAGYEVLEYTQLVKPR